MLPPGPSKLSGPVAGLAAVADDCGAAGRGEAAGNDDIRVPLANCNALEITATKWLPTDKKLCLLARPGPGGPNEIPKLPLTHAEIGRPDQLEGSLIQLRRGWRGKCFPAKVEVILAR